MSFKVVSSCSNTGSSSTSLVLHKSNNQTEALIKPVLKELNIQKTFVLGYSKPIDPFMAYATQEGVYICPLFTVELELLPKEIRPLNSDDARLLDIDFVQRLSDWLAHNFHLKKENVTPLHLAACKTILRLRENPKHFKLAINAGIAHELAHVILKHGEKIRTAHLNTIPYSGKWHLFNPNKWICFWNYLKVIKQCEREADQFASISLKKGLKGIEIGFRTWQSSLIELRQKTSLGWREWVLMKMIISPWGNPLPLYFTHGTFDQRIKWAREDHKLSVVLSAPLQ